MNKNQKPDSLIELAVTKGAHGIKGAVKLFLYNPENTSLKKNLQVYCVPKDQKISPAWFTIKELNIGNNIVASFKEINSRTELEKILP